MALHTYKISGQTKQEVDEKITDFMSRWPSCYQPHVGWRSSDSLNATLARWDCE